jgi:hypothetical protein
MKGSLWISLCLAGLTTTPLLADNGYPPPTGPYNPSTAPTTPEVQWAPPVGQENFTNPGFGGGYPPQGGYAPGYQDYGYQNWDYYPQQENRSSGFNPFNMMNSMSRPMNNMFGNPRDRRDDYYPAPPANQWGNPGYGYGYQEGTPYGYGYGHPQQYDNYYVPPQQQAPAQNYGYTQELGYPPAQGYNPGYGYQAPSQYDQGYQAPPVGYGTPQTDGGQSFAPRDYQGQYYNPRQGIGQPPMPPADTYGSAQSQMEMPPAVPQMATPGAEMQSPPPMPMGTQAVTPMGGTEGTPLQAPMNGAGGMEGGVLPVFRPLTEEEKGIVSPGQEPDQAKAE